jgi:hypothetical protein
MKELAVLPQHGFNPSAIKLGFYLLNQIDISVLKK